MGTHCLERQNELSRQFATHQLYDHRHVFTLCGLPPLLLHFVLHIMLHLMSQPVVILRTVLSRTLLHSTFTN